MSRSALRGIDHYQQFHQMMVARRARRLDEENVVTTDVLVDFHKRLAVRKTGDGRIAQGHANCFANLFRERTIRITGENLQRGVSGHEVTARLAALTKGRKPFSIVLQERRPV